jgi:hypothetical protein
MDQYRTIVHPLATESAMKKIEDHNTLVFIVDLKVSLLSLSHSDSFCPRRAPAPLSS